MVRILRRQRPWHVGHTPASNEDLLSLEPAVLASVPASDECKRWGNGNGELSKLVIFQQRLLELWL